jgi:hypothetical protein
MTGDIVLSTYHEWAHLGVTLIGMSKASATAEKEQRKGHQLHDKTKGVLLKT